MMEGLGRLFNIAPIAAGTPISLKRAAGITFVCTGADTFTLYSSNTYNGAGTTLAAISRYYKCTSTAGGAQWTDSGDLGAPVDAVTIASGALAFYVDGADLPAGSDWAIVKVGASGLVAAIVHDLFTQQGPKVLAPLSGANS